MTGLGFGLRRASAALAVLSRGVGFGFRRDAATLPAKGDSVGILWCHLAALTEYVTRAPPSIKSRMWAAA